jgi:hypothetical protein
MTFAMSKTRQLNDDTPLPEPPLVFFIGRSASEEIIDLKNQVAKLTYQNACLTERLENSVLKQPYEPKRK